MPLPPRSAFARRPCPGRHFRREKIVQVAARLRRPGRDVEKIMRETDQSAFAVRGHQTVTVHRGRDAAARSITGPRRRKDRTGRKPGSLATSFSRLPVGLGERSYRYCHGTPEIVASRQTRPQRRPRARQGGAPRLDRMTPGHSSQQDTMAPDHSGWRHRGRLPAARGAAAAVDGGRRPRCAAGRRRSC